MRKICVFVFSIFLLITSFAPSKMPVNDICHADEETTTYAKATTLCLLYKTPTLDADIDNVYFVVPETYFVTILEIISNDCMRVQYGNYVGYVDSSTVVVATFIPIVKVLENITCDIKDTSGTQIWTRPSASSSVLTTIPAGTKNIKYIAMAYGKIPSGGESNVWYYVNYTPESNSTNVYEGYVYSENITNLTEIASNTETNPDLAGPGGKNDDYAISISSPVRAIIIALITIPVIILVLVILYKISKQIKLRSKSNAKMENPNVQPKFNFNYENNIYNQPNNLRNEIHHMSEQPYVKKVTPYHSNNNNYPVYPTYDSDDDLL